ncbi:hypothetical protein J6590_084356 [Homalodisca vitripennis]|nr:hypothetical protein J6590_084356 [Homalodisca vitripennis]
MTEATGKSDITDATGNIDMTEATDKSDITDATGKSDITDVTEERQNTFGIPGTRQSGIHNSGLSLRQVMTCRLVAPFFMNTHFDVDSSVCCLGCSCHSCRFILGFNICYKTAFHVIIQGKFLLDKQLTVMMVEEVTRVAWVCLRRGGVVEGEPS